MQAKPLIISCLAASALAALAPAQTLLVPTVANGADGNTSTSWPFDTANIDVQYIYDSSHFTSAGITFPIIINRIRIRANGSTTTSWTGGTSSLQLDLSTAPIDYAVITNTFASNHGPDQLTVFNGNLTTLAGSTTAGTPGPFHVDIPFTTPFLYDPTLGNDLTIEYISQGVATANNPSMDAVSTAGVAKARRIQTTTIGNPTGTIWSGESAHAIEFTYTPANGLFAGFSVDVVSGPSPLVVNFTDTSFSSDPGGVQSWSWDFDGDNIPDDFTQNPQHVYNGCGDFTVSLTVTDLAHPSSTETKPNLISTDDITASFTTSLFLAPNVFQLTDTSTPPATAWAWDTNGDNVPDDFTQNPIVVTTGCVTNITLTATRNCKSDSASTTLFVPPANSLTTLFADNNGLTSPTVMSDYQVLNPLGIDICAFDHNVDGSSQFGFDVYVTEGSYSGKDNDITQWRLAASGSGTATGSNNPSLGALDASLHLPFGSYGVAIAYQGVSVNYTGVGAHAPFVIADANLQITTGASRSTLFNGGSFFEYRNWNGTVYYETCADSGLASYGFMGSGCAGTLPVGGQTLISPPVLGTNLSVQFDNLPFDVTIMALGFSNTIAPNFGGFPLPIDGGLVGAPGCLLRVDPELTFFSLGAAGSATVSVFIPADPVFQCLPFYTQALTPDPTGNAFGWVVSDAAGGVIGI